MHNRSHCRSALAYCSQVGLWSNSGAGVSGGLGGLGELPPKDVGRRGFRLARSLLGSFLRIGVSGGLGGLGELPPKDVGRRGFRLARSLLGSFLRIGVAILGKAEGAALVFLTINGVVVAVAPGLVERERFLGGLWGGFFGGGRGPRGR